MKSGADKQEAGRLDLRRWRYIYVVQLLGDLALPRIAVNSEDRVNQGHVNRARHDITSMSFHL